MFRSAMCTAMLTRSVAGTLPVIAAVATQPDTLPATVVPPRAASAGSAEPAAAMPIATPVSLFFVLVSNSLPLGMTREMRAVDGG